MTLAQTNPQQTQTQGKRESSAPNAEMQAVSRKVLNAFQGPIEPVRTSFLYRLGLAGVSLTMIALVLVYLSLIALVAYGVYYHATHNSPILTHRVGRGAARAAFFAYFGPLVAGVVLVIFMIKPLFARPARVRNPLVLREHDQPLLFEFIRRICATVHAPFPKSIELDSQVNASASFYRGWLGLVRGELVLTIGMPLLSGLNMRQLAGVIAHEFGHFSQRGGMRLTYVASSINNWLTRVVYERDRVDEWFDNVAHHYMGRSIATLLLVAVTMFLVWLTRRVLWVLMMLGHLVTFFMFRQMEFDADRYEARLAGSLAYESTTLQMNLLNAALNTALGECQESWQERKLPNDLPALILNKVAEIPEEVKSEIDQSLREQKTQLLATHPSDGARIARAREEATKGVFLLEEPASLLLANYKSLAQECSVMVYHTMLGEEFAQAQLVDTREIEARRAEANQQFTVLDSYYLGLWTMECPLTFQAKALEPGNDLMQSAREIAEVRQQLLDKLGELRETRRRRQTVSKRQQCALAGMAILGAGLSLSKGALDLPSNTLEGVSRFANEANERARAIDQEMEPVAELARRRLTLALGLLHHPSVLTQLGTDYVLPDEAERLLGALVVMRGALKTFSEMRKDLIRFEVLYASYEEAQEKEPLVKELQRLCRILKVQLESLHQELARELYPFEHARADETLAHFIAGSMADLTEQDAPSRAAQAIDNFETLYQRLLGKLGQIAVAVEQAVGLDPLPAETAPVEA